jgi:xanthine/CO dehydrogenase XdhC/CoxF family maturation factor
MGEVKFLVESAERLRAAGEPFLVATVVRVRGSSYRRPGARMLLTRDRWVAGSVSGGCLEGDVIKKAWWRTEAGAALVTYDTRAEDEIRWGFGLGCDGVVDVLLERAGQGGIDPLALFARCIERQKQGALATVFRSSAAGVPVGSRVKLFDGAVESDPMDPRARELLTSGCAATLSSACAIEVAGAIGDRTLDAFVEPVRPPVRLFVFGAGHDAVPVVQIARTIGWDVMVCEPHARLGTRARFAHADAVLAIEPAAVAETIDAANRAVAVVMGHDYARDRACLEALVASRVRYIGMLGPRRRTERMRSDLGLPALDPRIHAPVGLAIGAETPHEIALAIVSEIQSVLAKTSGLSLCDQAQSLHGAIAAE